MSTHWGGLISKRASVIRLKRLQEHPATVFMITIAQLLHTTPIESSAVHLLNQLLHHPAKTYSNNQGTYWDIGGSLGKTLRQIKHQINTQTYEFQPYLKRTKRMKNKKVRDLYLPTWKDRIVERWLNESLNRKLHSWFSRHSYAYRHREFGLDACQWNVLRSISSTSLIIKRDITNCFYTINQDMLLEQIRELVDQNDYLYKLLQNRVKFPYFTADNQEIKQSIIGIPFGSSLACILANIYLTGLDRSISELPVKYFRYADDFLVVTDDPTAAVEVAKRIEAGFAGLELGSKPSHNQNLAFIDYQGFTKVSKFKYLGLEFTNNRMVRLSREKQRKIINFVKRELALACPRKLQPIGTRITACVDAVNLVMTNRIRSVAIIDYYLKHVTDEKQLKNMDMLIVQHVISTVLKKPFRYRDFSKISYGSLRKAGLTSLVHRRRLHIQGHLNVPFLKLHNRLVYERFMATHAKRLARINHTRLARKLKKLSGNDGDHKKCIDQTGEAKTDT